MVAHPTHTEFERIINHFLGERIPGRPKQGIDVVSTVQNYVIGARTQLGDKVYHYAYAGNILIPDAAVKVRNPQDIGNVAIVTALVTGDTFITLTVGATDGPTANGLIPANYLRGGTVVVFVAGGNKTITRGILSNTAQAIPAVGGPITVEVDAPIPCAVIVAGSSIEVMASVYANVVHYLYQVEAAGFTSTVGVATVPAVEGDYLWLQTWGPCWITPASGEINEGVDNLAVGFKADGGVSDLDDVGNHVQILSQKAGHILCNARGGGCGAPFIRLMIDP